MIWREQGERASESKSAGGIGRVGCVASLEYFAASGADLSPVLVEFRPISHGTDHNGPKPPVVGVRRRHPRESRPAKWRHPHHTAGRTRRTRMAASPLDDWCLSLGLAGGRTTHARGRSNARNVSQKGEVR